MEPVERNPALSAVDRFQSACERDPLVVAAFLGGSYAAGTATERSDIDIYLATTEKNYPAFFDRREEFMRTWAEPKRLATIVDFERLGFDLLDFELRDGVRGQLALGHTGNFMALHGGPHRVLIDKIGLLDGVTFPRL
jgi:predicted nucleotidyltransferase